MADDSMLMVSDIKVVSVILPGQEVEEAPQIGRKRKESQNTQLFIKSTYTHVSSPACKQVRPMRTCT